MTDQQIESHAFILNLTKTEPILNQLSRILTQVRFQKCAIRYIA